MAEERKVIGIDLGGTMIRAGRVMDRVLDQVAGVTTASKREEREVVEQTIVWIAEIWDRNVTGIGVKVPAIVDAAKS